MAHSVSSVCGGKATRKKLINRGWQAKTQGCDARIRQQLNSNMTAFAYAALLGS
jgi:hypothetical protein